MSNDYQKSKKAMKICLLPGDGIGPEVVQAAVKVLVSTGLMFEFIEGDIGYGCYQKTGSALPNPTIEKVKKVDSALFGAVTTPPNIPNYKSPIVALRRELDLYINLRPNRAFPGVGIKPDLNIILFRENTEGLYAGIESFDPEKGLAITERHITTKGSERIIRAAFTYAKKQGRKKITVVHKANIMRETCGLFLRVAKEVKKEFPTIEMDDMIVDAAAMQLIRKPGCFDVIVTTNMFGDILADETCALVGGLGLAASGNIGDRYSVFEPVHGSAPKYAGTNKANPIATIRAAQMMLTHLGHDIHAQKIEKALEYCIENKKTTADLGGNLSTIKAAEAIIQAMNR